MMERTINGRPLKECLDILSKPMAKSKLKGTNFYYIKIGDYISRMDEAFGICGYTVESLDPVTCIVTKSGQELFTTRCRVSLIADDGKLICFKDGVGGKEPTYANETGLDGGIKNLPNNVLGSAFKNACKKFGIFGETDSDDDDSSPDSAKNSNDANKPKAKDETYDLLITGDYESIGDDTQSGKPKYSVTAVSKENKDDKYFIIFYPNQYTKVAEKFNRMLSNKPRRILIKASQSSEKDGVKSLVFKNYA